MMAIFFGSIALLLFIAELMFLDFTCFVFALGFALSAFLSFIFPAVWWIYLILALVFSLIFMFSIKKPLKAFFSAKKSNDNFFDEQGTGIIKSGMIEFKGTLWKAQTSGLKEGDEVKVLGVKDGKIIFER